MKICHFIASKGLGRGEAYIDLVNSLCETTEIVLLIPKDALYKNRIHPNITVFQYKSRNSRKNPFLLLEIYKLMKTINPDIVHTHFAKATEIFYHLNKMLKYNHIGTKHNPRKGKIFNKISNVIAVSKGVAKSVQNSNVHVIYNGIDPINIAEKKEKNSIFTICAIGRLDAIKGFDILIKECAKLSFDFKLEIVGEGDERANLQRLIDSYGLQKNVQLLGFQKDIPQKMAKSNLVIQTSHSEGFSLVMVEALFYANLFVSTKVSGATEILDEKFLIDKFNIADKLNNIFNNYACYKKHFDSLKDKQQDNFTLKNIVHKYYNYYKDCISHEK